MYLSVSDVRDLLAQKYQNEQFITDKTGVNCVELVGTCFKADEDTIFGKVNHDYIGRELAWYDSQSLYVKDIPGGTPKIWEMVSDEDGKINSNYGWAIFHHDNHRQYQNCVTALLNDRDTRRAEMIYTRPSMQYDYNANGMSDFMCTNTVQYMIRGNKLHAIVNMRSNDAWAGYRNDFAWQKEVQQRVVNSYNKADRAPGVCVGDIYWQAGSLHVYESQFYLLEHYLNTGEYNVTKKEVENAKD